MTYSSYLKTTLTCSFLLFFYTLAKSQIIQYKAPLDLEVNELSFIESTPVISGDIDLVLGITFSPDGNRMFVTDGGQSAIIQYNLSSPFDISSALNIATSFSVSDQETGLRGITFNLEGSKLYVVGTGGSEINQYSLSNPFDLSSGVSFDGNPFDLSDQITSPSSIQFDQGGNRLFILDGATQSIAAYDVTTPFDITSGVSFTGNQLSVAGTNTSSEDLVFDPSGTKFLVGDLSEGTITQYHLSIPFDITSLMSSHTDEIVFLSDGTDLGGLALNANQTLLYSINAASGNINTFQISDSNVFFESVTEAGVLLGEMTITLFGDTFSSNVSDNLTIGNLPAGLRHSISISGNGSTLALTIEGASLNHSNANSIEDLTFNFSDDAFTTLAASSIENTINANSGLGLVFDPAPTVISEADGFFYEGETGLVLDLDAITRPEQTLNITYSLDSFGDQRFFFIDNNTGQISVVSPINFETVEDEDSNNVYSLRVNASNGLNTVQQEVNLTLENVRQILSFSAPVDVTNDMITLEGTPLSVAEQENDITGFNISTFRSVFTFQNLDHLHVIGANNIVYQYILSDPFDITGEVNFNSQSFSLEEEVANPTGVRFNNDGERMFILTESEIRQYSLPSRFDISPNSNGGPTFENVTFDLTSFVTSARDMVFTREGLRMFILDGNSNTVLQFELNRPFNLSDGALFSNKSLLVSAQDIDPRGIALDASGSRLLVFGDQNNQVYQYTLSTPFDLSTATFDGSPLTVLNEDDSPRDIFLSPDGTTMFLAGSSTDEISQYVIADNNVYQETSENQGAVTGEMLVAIAGDRFSEGINLSPISNALPSGLEQQFILDQSRTFGRLTLSGNTSTHNSSNNISTLTLAFNSDAFEASSSTEVTGARDRNSTSTLGLEFLPDITINSATDGTFFEGQTVELFDLNARSGSNSNDIDINYSLNEVGDFSFFAINDSTGVISAPAPLDFESPADFNGDRIFELEVHLDNGVSTADQPIMLTLNNVPEALSYSSRVDFLDENVVLDEGTFSVTPQEDNVFSMNFSEDGTKMFILGDDESIYQYSLTTPFDITQGVSHDGSPLAIADIGTFQGPKAITFSRDGSQLYIVGDRFNTIWQVSLNSPFDVTQGSSGFISRSVFSLFELQIGLEGNYRDIAFSADGTRLFLLGNDLELSFASGRLYELSLNGDAFDISSGLTHVGTSSISTNSVGLAFTMDITGTAVLLAGDNPIIGVTQRRLPSPFDLSGSSSLFEGRAEIADQENRPTSIKLSTDGTRMFVIGENGGEIHQYTLSDRSLYEESINNDGTLEGSMLISIAGDQLVSPGEEISGFTVENIPAGLNASLLVDESGFLATLSLTGSANNNDDTDDVEALSVSFANSAFFNSNAADFDNAINFNTQFGIDFIDEGAPIFQNNVDTIQFQENSQQIVIDINAIDGPTGAIDEGITYSLLDSPDQSAFTINAENGILTFINAPNFEEPADNDANNHYLVQIGADNGVFPASIEVVIEVLNINEAPTVVSQTFTVNENSPNGTVVGTLVASDDDGDNLTYGITSNAFTINENTGLISVLDQLQLDFATNPSFTIPVEVSDGVLSSEVNVTIDLNNVNEPPVFISETVITTDENTPRATLIGTVQAVDDDGMLIEYSTNSQIFSVGRITGRIVVNDSEQLDFETNPIINFNVSATDGTFTAQTAITVTLNDVNESPVVGPASFSVDENVANGTVIGNLLATDEDGDELTFITDSDIFAINAQNGQLTVLDNTQLDFEMNANFEIIVVVSDGMFSQGAIVTIVVNDVNESPTAEDQTVEIPEQLSSSTLVTTIEASDPENDPLTYTILSGNGLGGFSLDSNTGELHVDDEAVLDFETTSGFSLTIEISDGAFVTTNNLSIVITDVNESPIAESLTVQIEEGSDAGTLITTIEASDPENDPLTYTILEGNEQNGFSLGAESGELTVNDGTALDFETMPILALTVQISDGENTIRIIVTVQLIDIDDIVTSTNSDLLGSVKVYPVPTKEIVNVQFINRTFDEANVTLMDVSGKIVSIQKRKIGDDQLQLDLSLLPDGIYSVIISADDDKKVFRVSKTSGR